MSSILGIFQALGGGGAAAGAGGSAIGQAVSQAGNFLAETAKGAIGSKLLGGGGGMMMNPMGDGGSTVPASPSKMSPRITMRGIMDNAVDRAITSSPRYGTAAARDFTAEQNPFIQTQPAGGSGGMGASLVRAALAERARKAAELRRAPITLPASRSSSMHPFMSGVV